MSGVNFTNFTLLARSFDKDKNGIVNELQANENVRARVDINNDGKISTKELSDAMRADAVEVNNGRITESRGFNVYTNGLESLKNINTIANNSSTYVFSSSYSDLKGQARIDALHSSNREYALAIRQMESSLSSINSISRGGNDSISRTVNSVSRNALNDAAYTRMIDFMGSVLDSGAKIPEPDPYTGNPGGEPDTSYLEDRNQNLRYAYQSLNNALRNIQNTTSNLPDVKQTVRTADNSLTSALSNISAIRSDSQTPTQVKQKLYVLSDKETAQIKGRALPYGGVGAGVGAVAGAAIGYFAAGRNTQSALIGAGIGTAVAGGIGALIGHSVDKGHENKASDLKNLGDEIERYNPDQDEATLQNESSNIYNELLNIRDRHDIDSAIGSNSNLKSISSRTSEVEKRTARILGGYQIK